MNDEEDCPHKTPVVMVEVAVGANAADEIENAPDADPGDLKDTASSIHPPLCNNFSHNGATHEKHQDNATMDDGNTEQQLQLSPLNKKRKRTYNRRKRDPKAPKPPRSALELYQLETRKEFVAKYGANALPKDFASRKVMEFEKLSRSTLQEWKVAEAEDLVRYQRQLQQYTPSEGYDQMGNLLTIVSDGPSETDDVNKDEDIVSKSQHHQHPTPASKHEPTSPSFTKPMMTAADNSTTTADLMTLSSHRSTSLATASFTDMVYELLKFKMIKGHCRVPIKKAGLLGKWVEKLRKEYKKLKPIHHHDDNTTATSPTAQNVANLCTAGVFSSSLAVHENVRLDHERIQVLTHLGMIWDFPNDDYEDIWQTHFQQLQDFKDQHGHCNVPQKGHGKLSWWVKIQRELYVNTTSPQQQLGPRSRPRQTMPQHRIRQLESIGFEWRIRPVALKWEERYQELVEYKAMFGDCNVAQNYPPNRVLGKWVMKQRGFYYDKIRGRKSPLTKERQDKLEAIGFSWVAPHVCKTRTKLPGREDIVQQQHSKSTEERTTTTARATLAPSPQTEAININQANPQQQMVQHEQRLPPPPQQHHHHHQQQQQQHALPYPYNPHGQGGALQVIPVEMENANMVVPASFLAATNLIYQNLAAAPQLGTFPQEEPANEKPTNHFGQGHIPPQQHPQVQPNTVLYTSTGQPYPYSINPDQHTIQHSTQGMQQQPQQLPLCHRLPQQQQSKTELSEI